MLSYLLLNAGKADQSSTFGLVPVYVDFLDYLPQITDPECLFAVTLDIELTLIDTPILSLNTFLPKNLTGEYPILTIPFLPEFAVNVLHSKFWQY